MVRCLLQYEAALLVLVQMHLEGENVRAGFLWQRQSVNSESTEGGYSSLELRSPYTLDLRCPKHTPSCNMLCRPALTKRYGSVKFKTASSNGNIGLTHHSKQDRHSQRWNLPDLTTSRSLRFGSLNRTTSLAVSVLIRSTTS